MLFTGMALFSNPIGPAKRPDVRRFRPRLECLEDRTTPIATTTTLTAMPNPSTLGQPVSLDAHVFIASTQEMLQSQGSVTFRDGGGSLGDVPLNNGEAMLSAPSLGVGQHTLTAEFHPL